MINLEGTVRSKCLTAGWDHLHNLGHYWETTVEDNCWEESDSKKYEAHQETHSHKRDATNITNERIFSWDTKENRAVSKGLQNNYVKK